MQILDKSGPMELDNLKQQQKQPSKGIIDRAKPLVKGTLHTCSQTYRGMTSSGRLLPDFLIIGGQRCGTSSLYYYLTDHPDIISASTKETHFFDECFAKGLAWYQAQFPSSAHKMYARSVLKQNFITGEGTPYYILYPHAPKRAFEILPHVKIIALLRNPVERAYSQYWIEVKAGYETLSFEEAIKTEQERIAGELEKMLQDENYYGHSFRHFSYLTRGIYVDQLQNWLRYYPKEQLLTLKSEDLYSKPAETMQKTLKFLGVAQGELNKEYKNYRRPSKKGYRNQAVPPKMEANMR